MIATLYPGATLGKIISFLNLVSLLLDFFFSIFLCLAVLSPCNVSRKRRHSYYEICLNSGDKHELDDRFVVNSLGRESELGTTLRDIVIIEHIIRRAVKVLINGIFLGARAGRGGRAGRTVNGRDFDVHILLLFFFLFFFLFFIIVFIHGLVQTSMLAEAGEKLGFVAADLQRLVLENLFEERDTLVVLTTITL